VICRNCKSDTHFQKNTNEDCLEKIKNKVGLGYLRTRKDLIVEYTIGDRPSIRKFLIKVLPYLLIKKKQAKLMLRILDFEKKIDSPKTFLQLTELVDEFGQLNYSKKRKINTKVVRNHLIQKRVLTP